MFNQNMLKKKKSVESLLSGKLPFKTEGDCNSAVQGPAGGNGNLAGAGCSAPF